MILGINGVMLVTNMWIERAGDEIRIEIAKTATLNPKNGTVAVFHDTKLFEGTFENSGDSEGQSRGPVLIVKGAQKTLRYGVNNADEGGDWVSVSLVCTNISVGRSAL
jgi:hypothetical protein